MVFKKMLGAFGIGGPSVDTVLSQPSARPGASITGQVNLVGGSTDVDIEHITLSLITRIEVEAGGGEHGAVGDFHRLTVTGPMRLATGQELSLPFQLVLPWETPITAVHGHPLRGMVVGVRTDVAIARAVDKGDLDPIQVNPLPVQQRILDAFTKVGFVFKSADLEYGRIAGVRQTLPFFQEIEYYPPQQYAHVINEVELTFVANPQQVEVILEFDKRGGMFGGGQDSFGRYTAAHADADTTDWAEVVDGWLRRAVERRQAMPGYGAPAGHGYAHGSFGHREHRRHGSGMAGMAMGVAGGLAAGYLAGEMMDDVFDGGGDEGE